MGVQGVLNNRLEVLTKIGSYAGSATSPLVVKSRTKLREAFKKKTLIFQNIAKKGWEGYLEIQDLKKS